MKRNNVEKIQLKTAVLGKTGLLPDDWRSA
jgi:hypothetical protein